VEERIPYHAGICVPTAKLAREPGVVPEDLTGGLQQGGAWSMSRLVYVTQPIREEALTLLRAAADVVVGFGPDAQELESVLPEVHAILVRTSLMPAESIDRARSLRVIARHGVGVDNIAVDAAPAGEYPS
jgi:hypothetical protein